MPIITIYRGAFTAGEEIAKGVAQALGYRCVSREVLVEASRSYGISEAKLNEILEKEPHWWQRWLENMRPYRIALQAAMCEVAQGGNVVYHGHIGHELLPGIRHVLKVMLTAPLEFRIKQVQSQQGLDEAEGTALHRPRRRSPYSEAHGIVWDRLAGHNAIRSGSQCGPSGDRRRNTGHC